jgi:hypothetical protein
VIGNATSDHVVKVMTRQAGEMKSTRRATNGRNEKDSETARESIEQGKLEGSRTGIPIAHDLHKKVLVQ